MAFGLVIGTERALALQVRFIDYSLHPLTNDSL